MSKRITKQSRNKSKDLLAIAILLLVILFFSTPYDVFMSTKSDMTNEDLSYQVSESTREGSKYRRVSLIAFGLLGIGMVLNRKRKRVRIQGCLGLLVIFFVMWAVLSIAWAEDAVFTIRKVGVLVMIFIGALGLTLRLSFDEVIRLFFIISFFVVTGGILSEIVLGSFQPLNADYRYGGWQHPNLQALDCGLLVLSSLFLIRFNKNKWVLFLLLCIFGSVSLYLTKSRAVFWSCVAAAGVYWAIVSSWRSKGAWGLLVSSLLCLVLLAMGPEFNENAMNALLLYYNPDSISTLTGRITLWEASIQEIFESPFLGRGYNSFWTPERILALSSLHNWSTPNMHNGYIDMFLGLGVLGGIVFILILALGLVRSLSLYKSRGEETYAFAFAVIIFLSVSNLMGSRLLDPHLLTIVFFTIVSKLAFVEET